MPADILPHLYFARSLSFDYGKLTIPQEERLTSGVGISLRHSSTSAAIQQNDTDRVWPCSRIQLLQPVCPWDVLQHLEQ